MHVILKEPLRKGKKLEIAKAELIEKGQDIALLAVGTMVEESQKMIEILKEKGYSPSIYNMRFVKPLDTKLLDELANSYKYVITLEEGSLNGGFGSGVVEYYQDTDQLSKIKLHRIGIEDRFIEHGTRPDLFKDMGLDYESLAINVENFVSQKASSGNAS